MERQGFSWPDNDQHCWQVVFQSLNDLERCLRLTPKRRTVVQAGGNCGVWAKYLSKVFETVYTFEPDSVNFLHLARNVPETNVVKLQAALGCTKGLVRTSLEPHEKDNIGAYHVESGGIVPTILIDDLGLRDVDLLYLDIEGAEYHALLGATRTITYWKPVIALELKGLGKRFGYEDGEVFDWLKNLGYAQIDHYANDFVFRCLPEAGKEV